MANSEKSKCVISTSENIMFFIHSIFVSSEGLALLIIIMSYIANFENLKIKKGLGA